MAAVRRKNLTREDVDKSKVITEDFSCDWKPIYGPRHPAIKEVFADANKPKDSTAARLAGVDVKPASKS